MVGSIHCFFQRSSFVVRCEEDFRSARMSAPAVTAPVKVAKKKTASAKPKKVAAHPKYSEMINDALTNLKVLIFTTYGCIFIYFWLLLLIIIGSDR